MVVNEPLGESCFCVTRHNERHPSGGNMSLKDPVRLRGVIWPRNGLACAAAGGKTA